ncbi:SRPBCC family protein [Erythrobacter sp. Alg231-14]|uniref:SRPBCC family protein n=1 Tax=Erythrobacter sp. Alg231-14 TaxID=1922225 RepID=UPI00307BE0C9
MFRRMISLSVGSIAMVAAALGAAPALAEVVETDDDHFITRAEAIVSATPTETWLALISPARWWSSEHTWSADAANLSLTPQAGGCFCERIPEVDEPGRFTLEGSVEHMRVIQAYPNVALRMQGALGPLQSEPVTGILTIAISEAENGTRIVWEYNVGGQMRYPAAVISNAVDGVMTLQLTRLSAELGQVQAPVIATVEPSPPEETAPEVETSELDLPEGDAPSQDEPFDLPSGDGPTIAIDPEAVIDEAPSSPSVDDAFGDLSDG